MDKTFAPIKIEGIVDSEIGTPRNDGRPGSSLYSVPLKLSASAPREWAEIFVEAYDNPSEWSSMHRRGIASVQGNRVVLDGTTIEEIEKTHKKTLMLALDVANREYPTLLAKRAAAAAAEQNRIDDHKKAAADAAKKVKFD